MISFGLATSEEAIFDLDSHAIMPWGRDPVLERHYVPKRSQRARSVLSFLAQDSGTHNLSLCQHGPLQGEPGPGGDRVLRPLEGAFRARPAHGGDVQQRLNHPGSVGGSSPLKGRWSHATREDPGEGVDGPLRAGTRAPLGTHGVAELLAARTDGPRSVATWSPGRLAGRRRATIG